MSSNSSKSEKNASCVLQNDNLSKSVCPIDHTTTSSIFSQGIFANGDANPKQLIDNGYNAPANDVHFDHTPTPDQKIELRKIREISTIPKGEFSPSHQPANVEKWVYPSEQQYFNAMKRKGFNPHEQDVPVVLAIHNHVNEKGWSEILKWEKIRGCQNPKLIRFMGRPTDLSPRAFLQHHIWGYTLPFDRHDWIVDRDGREVRYVIDFYKGKELVIADRNMEHVPSRIPIFLEVRPALDSLPAFYDRIYIGVKKYFPEIDFFIRKRPPTT